ncbi:hypothetical protein ACFO3J_24840 [Streptomyces polygonati]|uniref:Tyr recombinase domain-containing protein n=1 Tax=Streptomyces polygonati TaxID=1617087 RepID=A0ABV8HUV9_9ACTN
MDRQRRGPRRTRAEEPAARRGPHRALPPSLVAIWRDSVQTHGTAQDGRLFFTEHGNIVGYTIVHRAWNEARALALPPELAATPLGKRPYDLRHSALSTWLAAGAAPAEVAQRAGNSVEVLLTRYAKCLYDPQSISNQRIEHLLSACDTQSESDRGR